MFLVSAFTTLAIDVLQSFEPTSASKLALYHNQPFNCTGSVPGDWDTRQMLTQTNSTAPVEDDCRIGYGVAIWLGYFFYVVYSVVGYILAERYYRGLRVLRRTVTNFDVAETKLGKESDRVVLLAIINELFTKQDADDQISDLDGAPVADAPHPDRNAQLALDAQQVGDTLHAHQLGLTAEPNQPNGRSSESNIGLEAFNRSVRTDVYHQLPISGVRSWNLYGYYMAVLVRGSWLIFNFWDEWGYIKTGEPAETSSTAAYFAYQQNARSIIALAYAVLVLNPFMIFLFSIQIKFFLWLHELSGLSGWANYALFLPLYLFFDLILMLRLLIDENISHLVTVDLMAGAVDYHTLWYTPFYAALPTFLFYYHDENEPYPQWYQGYRWDFDKSWWTAVLFWLFIILPITCFTYWLYEPIWLQKWRLQKYHSLVKAHRQKSHAMEVEAREHEHVEEDYPETEERQHDDDHDDKARHAW
jgi:hypothetical protein